MALTEFIVIGENIHCTRVFKRDGTHVARAPDGRDSITFSAGGATRYLPVPPAFQQSAEWGTGKVKHCAVAIWQGLYGSEADRAAGVDYLQTLARRQAEAGATFLDVNVDEFGADPEDRIRAMKWAAAVVQKAAPLPLSIDSSNPAILRAGLQTCDPARGQPVINSVSLERLAAIEVATEFKAAVVASAAGEKDLPCTVEDRLINLARLLPQLAGAGIRNPAIYVDPLVFPIATDPLNGRVFLDAVAAVRKNCGADIHIAGGLSNVSFGMPSRKLINIVFARLAVEAGADGGIVDPLQINGKLLRSLNTETESFRMAKALLTGEDPYGMDFITAHREGRLRD
jgi:5-methyltetrahydrofolate--homocysteine methyltransferase